MEFVGGVAFVFLVAFVGYKVLEARKAKSKKGSKGSPDGNTKIK